MQAEKYVDLARKAWDEAAPIHWRRSAALVERFADPAATCLPPRHAQELLRIGLAGRRVAQLNCNNGRELVSILGLGAREGTGFDISRAFIDQARQLAAAARAPAEFVVTDVYQIPAAFDGTFDLVVVTAGALCFMPDLRGYLAVAQRLLASGGVLNIHDCHPITDMLELDRDRDRGERPVQLVRSYFDRRPLRHTSGLDYVGNTTYAASEVYYFHHTLADIFQAAIASGLVVEHFDETPDDPSGAYPRLARSEVLPPLSFMLTLKKPG